MSHVFTTPHLHLRKVHYKILSEMCPKWTLLSFVLSGCLVLSAANTSTTPDVTTYKDAAGVNWQYAPTQAGSAHGHHEKMYDHHYGHMGTRQGALIGSPLYGVFPIIFLIGLAAIIIIPLLFFTFSPYGGFGGGFGQGAYGRKRSLMDDWDLPSVKKNLLDLVITVSEAIEKYGAMDSKKKDP